MALRLDEKVGLVRIDQFASQIEHLTPEVKEFLEDSFSGKHSKEFYEGLLAAYANTYIMINGLDHEQLKEYSGPIVAFVANHLKKLE